MKKILLAGIGNIFQGDDAFGCEVIRRLDRSALPEGVTVIDYGIRSYDLAYALLEDYSAVILLDATARGQEPGTLFVLELNPLQLGDLARTAIDPHAMNPVAVIQMAQSLGGIKADLFLVGCEPAVLDCPEGQMGLSETVEAAVPQAVHLTLELVQQVFSGRAVVAV